MNMFCNQCGERIPDGSNFCSYCGKSIIDNTNINQNNNSCNNNFLKIVSLVIGIVSIILSFLFNFFVIPLAIVGLILGIVYSNKEKKFCAGIVLNILGIIIPIIIILFLLVVYNNVEESIKNLWNDINYQENYNDNNDNNNSNNSYYEDKNTDYNYDENIIYDSNEEEYKGNSNHSIETNYFKEVNINNLINMIDNKEDFILVISQTYCSHCTSYKPKIEEIANNKKITVYYIEYNLLSSDERSLFDNYINITGTPTTVFFEDGEERLDATRINGNTSKETIENVLKSNGYIS